MGELREGGYPKTWRLEVLQSALKGYARFWDHEVNGTGYVNRPGWITRNKRRAAKLEGYKNWFQPNQKGHENQTKNSQKQGKTKPIKRYESVLFCTYTPRSELRK